MSDYQVRKDIDRFKGFLDILEERLGLNHELTDEDIEGLFNKYYDTGQIDSMMATKIDTTDLFDKIYPIGSIYICADSTFDPSEVFGGTWEQVKDRFLLARGDTYPLPDEHGGDMLTGGEAEHILTEDEMPSHTHEQEEHYHKMYGQYRSGSGSQSAMANSGSNNSAVDRYTDSRVAVNKNTGGGQAHNNMPPYLVVNVWQRTA